MNATVKGILRGENLKNVRLSDLQHNPVDIDYSQVKPGYIHRNDIDTLLSGIRNFIDMTEEEWIWVHSNVQIVLLGVIEDIQVHTSSGNLQYEIARIGNEDCPFFSISISLPNTTNDPEYYQEYLDVSLPVSEIKTIAKDKELFIQSIIRQWFIQNDWSIWVEAADVPHLTDDFVIPIDNIHDGEYLLGVVNVWLLSHSNS